MARAERNVVRASFDCQVRIDASGRFIPPTPGQVPECLDVFEKYHHEVSDIDPLIRAFMAHYQFETIHPFRDGNGRVGRLLLSLTIYIWLGLSSPWLYMSAFFERHKDEYIDRLFMVSANGEWDRWIEFCLTGVVEQSVDAIERIDKLVALRARYAQLVGRSGGSARLHRILDKLFEGPVTTVPQVQALTGVTYPTARSDIKRLVDMKILREGPEPAYPKHFFAPEILQTAFKDD
jgi:Fic family protein